MTWFNIKRNLDEVKFFLAIILLINKTLPPGIRVNL
jgi:hypothetical protein